MKCGKLPVWIKRGPLQKLPLIRSESRIGLKKCNLCNFSIPCTENSRLWLCLVFWQVIWHVLNISSEQTRSRTPALIALLISQCCCLVFGFPLPPLVLMRTQNFVLGKKRNSDPYMGVGCSTKLKTRSHSKLLKMFFIASNWEITIPTGQKAKFLLLQSLRKAGI